MAEGIAYQLRVLWASARKDIKIALTERTFTILGIFIPINFLVLLSLFVLAGSRAPTAVVMEDSGPYAHHFYEAMSQAHSFALQQTSAAQAQQLIETGKIVAVVTIPAQFDRAIQQNQPVQVGVEINNLNTDFTNDIRRAVPLSITSFYAKAFPALVTISPREHDFYRQDTDYLPYLTVSILVIGLMLGGLLQAASSSAREWERETVKELLLSPASRGAILIGKMVGAFLLSLGGAGVVLLVQVFVIGVWPDHWGEVIGFTLLTLTIFIATGTWIGTVLKRRDRVAPLCMGSAIPLFFMSGAFGPVTFQPLVTQVIANSFPVSYAIALMQHAFHTFLVNPYGLGVNVLVLCGYALGMLALATLALRRSTVAH